MQILDNYAKHGPDICKSCVSDKPWATVRKVVVANSLELCSPAHRQRLARALKTLKISRRKIPEWMVEVIHGFDGEMLWPNGKPFVIHPNRDIDDILGDDRWLSNFMKRAEIPPKLQPAQKIIDRLRLIDLAFRIEYPNRQLSPVFSPRPLKRDGNL